MSKAVKKVFKAVKKTVKKVGKFVKKHWKKIAIAAAVVFTAGAFAVVGTGASWGTAFSSIGTTFSAGASALTGGLVGTSAASAAGSGVLGTTALTNATAGALGAQGTAAAGTLYGSGTATLAQTNAMVAGANVANAAAVTGSQVGMAGGSWLGGAGGQAAVAGGTTGTVAAGTSAAATTGGGLMSGMAKASLANTALQAYGGYQDGKAEEERADKRSYWGMTADGKTNLDLNYSTPTAHNQQIDQGQQAPEGYQYGNAGYMQPNQATPKTMDDLAKSEYGYQGYGGQG